MGRASNRLARHDLFVSIPLHDNDGSRLSCHHLVLHSTSFLSPLMPPPSCHPILGKGVGAGVSFPYSSDTSPDTTRVVAIPRPRGRFTSCAHHRFRRYRTSRSSSRSSRYSSSPTCCPRARSQLRADQRSSTRVRGESIILLAFLRACRRGGHGGICHAYVILAMRSPDLRY
jgi:hypothetical protein